MVEPAMNVGKSGLQSWLLQRMSAIVLLGYFVFLLGYLIIHPKLPYQNWCALLEMPVMQMSSLLALLSLLMHTWIGIWTVITDYVKPFFIRLLLETTVLLTLFIYFVWGIKIIWRI